MLQISLALGDGNILLRGKLPVHIIGSFTLRVQFYNSGNMNEVIITVDITLGDTDEISSVITRGEIPNVSGDIYVAVAIMSYGQLGPFTSPSNRISEGNLVYNKKM